jgi:hypothetical protein
MRSFDIESMECLLEGCMPIIIKEIGPLVKHNRYLPFAWKLSRIWNTNYPPIDAICPQCGYSVKNDEIFPRNWRKRFLRKMSNFSLRIINWEVRKRSWILGLYVKIEMHK